MTALAATAGQNGTTALGAGTNQEAVRTGTLDLGGLVGTLGSHDISLPSRQKVSKNHLSVPCSPTAPTTVTGRLLNNNPPTLFTGQTKKNLSFLGMQKAGQTEAFPTKIAGTTRAKNQGAQPVPLKKPDIKPHFALSCQPPRPGMTRKKDVFTFIHRI